MSDQSPEFAQLRDGSEHTPPDRDPPVPVDLDYAVDPGRDSRPWHKRKALLVSTAVVVAVAVTVVTDLPQSTPRSSQISADKAMMSEVVSDIGPCSYALGESLTIYHDLTVHNLSASQTSEVPGLLRDDQAACSFTDQTIYDLSTVDVPGSTSGKDLGQLAATVTLWATSDALAAIEQIQTLSTRPSDTAAVAKLAQEEQLADRDRAQAEGELAAADRSISYRLPALHLTQAP